MLERKFPDKMADSLPAAVREVLLPLVSQVETLTESMETYDKKIEDLGSTNYDQTKLAASEGSGTDHRARVRIDLGASSAISQESGCGTVCGIGAEAGRFGDSEPQLRITKEGDSYLRKMLVQGAHYILSPSGPGYRFEALGPTFSRTRWQCAKKKAVIGKNSRSN